MNTTKMKSKASITCLVRSSFATSENLLHCFPEKHKFLGIPKVMQKKLFFGKHPLQLVQKNVRFFALEETISPVSEVQFPEIFFNTCFDKNNLKTVIAWFLENYGEKKTVDLVETLKHVGFHQATRAGVSLGVDDLQIPPQKAPLLSQASVKMLEVNQALRAGNLTNVEKSQRLIDTWNQTSETLRQAAVQNFRTNNPVNPVYMMAFSGARGNISQVRQLVAMRGLMADPQGAILEFPIQSNFREGLTVTEYLISCFGARKGLVDTALRTATSGYLTRRLVDAVQHVVIHVTNCHTPKGILITEKNLEQRLLGRVLLNDLGLDSPSIVKKNTLISGRLAKKIAEHHKEVYVRSPLTCQTEKSVCQLCYGLDLAQGKLVSLGEAVGIIAAQSIGEPGTQLTMRTFHTGGVGVFSDQAMKTLSAPFPGQIAFLSSLPGLFVRTLHGNIVYLLKHKSTDKSQIFLRLTGIDSPSNNLEKSNLSPLLSGKIEGKANFLIYEMKHEEVPSGSLLWVKQGEYVKKGQLLVQASRLQASRQEMPESTHPVRAALSGEVFFESIKTRLIEKGKLVKKRTTKNSRIQEKEKIAKEITPTIPFLRELGNFWVFSCFVQKETDMAPSFFMKGDLISPETPVQHYNLQVSTKGQLKQKHSSLFFVEPVFQFPVSKIHYSENFYFFITATENLLSYTTNSKSTGFTWYPFFQTFQIGRVQRNFQKASFNTQHQRFQKGYCLRLPLKIEETSSLFRGMPEKTNENSEKITEMRYLWSPHEVFNLATSQGSGQLNSCFMVGGETLSKGGLFQFHSLRRLVWSKSNLFKANFLKNNFNCSGRTEHGSTKLSSQSSFFLQTALKRVQLTPGLPQKVIEKKQGWFCVSDLSQRNFTKSQLLGVVLEPGKKFENISFCKSYVSLHLLSTKNVFLLKMKGKNHQTLTIGTTNKTIWEQSNLLSKKTFLDHTRDFLTLLPSPKPFVVKRAYSIQFCFFKKQDSRKTQESSTKKLLFETPVFQLAKKRRLFHLVFIQKNFYQTLPEKQLVYKKYVLENKNSCEFSLNSPFFSKQLKTPCKISPESYQNKNTKLAFNFVSPPLSGWMSIASFFKVDFQVQTSQSFGKLDEFQNRISSGQKLAFCKGFHSGKNKGTRKHSIPVPGVSVFFSRRVQLEYAETYRFQTFQDGWVLPHLTVTRAFILSKKLGEFQRIQKKQEDFQMSLLQTQDMLSLKVPNGEFKTRENKEFSSPFLDKRAVIAENDIPPDEKSGMEKNKVFFEINPSQKFPVFGVNFQFLQMESRGRGENTRAAFFQKESERFGVGARVRWGQEFGESYAMCASGQILKITPKKITLRKGTPLLASLRGLLHVTQGDMIQKNDILITLRSRRLQTEDIVQGIPKIEQLFEARETQGGELLQNNMHMLLKKFFYRAIQVKTVPAAVELSVTYIQKFLVQNILQAYSNQGVYIAEKHVEIVVRQMTSRIRITRGGESGFLPGEFVQLRVIEKINEGLVFAGHRPADYEPMILGITKSVLQSESFLLAASFQQVSKVLVRSALAKKTDFLRGLHENLLVGQLIPAGTGILSIPTSSQKTLDSFES